MEEYSEMIWKIWKKGKSKCEKIWKIRKKNLIYLNLHYALQQGE